MREFHGMKKSKEYRAWCDMKQRCFNPKNKAFHNYGGRGITVCDTWKNSFVAFFTDMGKSPFKDAELDRKNNDKNYSKDNCRWATKSLNIANKRCYDRILPRGVSFDNRESRKNKPFFSRIQIEGKMYLLGYYKTVEEAKDAHDIVFREWYGHDN